MIVYDMTLCLAKPGGVLTEREQKEFETGIESFNHQSVFMANPKKIELLGIDDNRIHIRLHSQNALPTPGRGLRSLTTILLKNSDCFQGRVTKGGQLFRILDAAVIRQPSDDTAVEPASVSDADFLKALIDYLISEKSSRPSGREKRAALEKMKQVAVESGFFTEER